MTDRFDLQRFVDAQARVYDTVVSELRAGRKRSHWIWFVFPQLSGLGSSAMAQRYADRLEHYTRLAPDNWFNFYDFWGEDLRSTR